MNLPPVNKPPGRNGDPSARSLHELVRSADRLISKSEMVFVVG